MCLFLLQKMNERPASPIEIGLELVSSGEKADLFHAALQSTQDLL